MPADWKIAVIYIYIYLFIIWPAEIISGRHRMGHNKMSASYNIIQISF